MKTVKIIVKGTVQGVGFRPFVYNIATKYKLSGYVKNKGNYVEILIKGEDNSIKNFLEDLKNTPPLAKIESLEIYYLDDNSSNYYINDNNDTIDNNNLKIKNKNNLNNINKFNNKKFNNKINYNNSNNDINNYIRYSNNNDKNNNQHNNKHIENIENDFKILVSEDENSKNFGTIPPDISICDDCLKELYDKKDRRYRYPFISCTNCGPRFTIVRRLPFDRENTSMDEFPLCEECLKEYTNPKDRRFHAQSTACPKCGPTVFLTDSKGNILYKKDEAIRKTVKLIKKGKIIGIKGIGGTHLVVDAKNNESVLKLRRLLNRPTQPFAIMCMDDTVYKIANFEKIEIDTVKSIRRPIVVMDKGKNYDKYVAPSVSNLNTIGVMLPYSPLHYLLFEEGNEIYVMTSANLPGLPMSIKNSEIVKNLGSIADYFLLHNREIVNRCDDSVMKNINNKMMFLRRSRGYTPEPIVVANNRIIENNDKIVLGLGAELNSTITLVKGNRFYMSQYIGNTSKYETFNFLKETVDGILKLTNTKSIDGIVCDLHPQYNSSKLGEYLANKYNYNCDLKKIQHHKAHGYSLLGDREIYTDGVIITMDGVGYGEDGKIWGGELFIYENGRFSRAGHLEEQKMPGGDVSTKYPIRMLISILSKKLDDDEIINFILKNKYNISERDLKLVLFQLNKTINVAKTTSTGRVLDSVAALLKVCDLKTYDGEPAIRLESFSERCLKYNNEKLSDIIKKSKDVNIQKNVLNTTDLVYNCYNMLLEGYNKSLIGYYIHSSLSYGLSQIAIDLCHKYGLNYVGLSGGVSYNRIITSIIREEVEKEGLKFVCHSRVPNGDGGISFGQCVGYLLDDKF